MEASPPRRRSAGVHARPFLRVRSAAPALLPAKRTRTSALRHGGGDAPGFRTPSREFARCHPRPRSETVGLTSDFRPVIRATDDDSPEVAENLPLVRKAFAANGWLHDKLGMSHRAGQARMAAAVCTAFEDERPLMVEAGTGVGKSLAYLIPGLLHAVVRKRKFVVSTHTIPLQEQILRKDLAHCRRLFGLVPELHFAAGFRHALLVGKSNYLCTTRLARALADKATLFGDERFGELQKLSERVREMKSGLREEIGDGVSDEVWEWVNADSSACNNRDCKPDECPYRKARAALRDADIVIVNHSLMFALLAAGMGSRGDDATGVLFPNDFVVFDEAHTVPEVATDHFGARVSSYAVNRALKMLWNKQRGLLRKWNKPSDAQLVADALAASEVFFNQTRETFLLRKSEMRLRDPNWGEPHLNLPLKHLEDRLAKLFDTETNQSTKAELGDFRKKISAFRAGLGDALALADEDESVYWVERSGREGRVVSVNAAPLDVAPILQKRLFGAGVSVVLPSATLSDGRDMTRFRAQVGAPKHTEGRIEPSPFDFPRVMEIYVASDAPEPGARAGAETDREYAADVAAHAIRMVPGGTLILCTANAELADLRDRLSDALRGERLVLAQGAGTPRTELVNRFREAGNAVLLGVSSFWTGVDIPGPALSQLIITRLPFENPSDPVVSARAERIAARGGSAFAEMTLPDAVIRFRQGVGRLIRTTEDRGRVVILDSRLISKPYGKHFVAALPHPVFTNFRRVSMLTEIPAYR